MRLYFAGFLPAGFNIVSAAYLSSSGRERGGFAISLVRGFCSSFAAGAGAFDPSGTGWYLAEFSGSGAVRSCSHSFPAVSPGASSE